MPPWRDEIRIDPPYDNVVILPTDKLLIRPGTRVPKIGKDGTFGSLEA
jgi:hypothetical protein